MFWPSDDKDQWHNELVLSSRIFGKSIQDDVLTTELRGRVGRGEYQSYCIFMSGQKSAESKERLSILNKSNDGFYIASEDLKLRGPGDLFGIRQSGVLDFKLADVFQDAKIMQRASEAAIQLMKRDPNLECEENRNLREYLHQYIKNGLLETTL